jgi:ABC-type phosphate transport system substrate-binding protein
MRTTNRLQLFVCVRCYLFALLPLLFVACQTPPKATPAVTLDISGSATLGEHLMPQLVLSFLNSAQYEILNTSDTLFQARRNDTLFLVRISPIGTGNGLTQLKADKIDLAMVSETIDSSFLKQWNISRTEAIFIASGRISIIAHRHNAVSTLTKTQLKGIFSGVLKDWAAVSSGQYQGRINLHLRNPESGTTHTFETLFLEKKPQTAFGKRHITNKSLLEDIKRDFYGIGFIAENELTYGNDIKRINIVNNDGSPQYLERPLSVVYKKRATENALIRDFTDFCRNDLAQDIAVSMGFFK